MNKQATQWFLFLASLSGQSANTPRVRLWRALKELGAATLRDGVNALPATDIHREKLEALCRQVKTDGGTACLLELPVQREETEAEMRAAFDRSETYQQLQDDLVALQAELPHCLEADARRRLRQIDRDFEAVALVDFFPGEIRKHTREAIDAFSTQINRIFSPQEPSMASGRIKRMDAVHYQNRLWATRQNLWVDRVASAWLIRRFIDSKARFLWLETIEDCPDEALGFDFDGASFSHVDDRVTFEVLQTSFALDNDPGLQKLAQLIHYLDVGGMPVAEAAGFEAVLAGLRESAVDDDALLAAVTPMLDALHRRFYSDT